MLILVRHAHAGDKRLWPFGDVDRPLSTRGEQQAQGIAQLLSDLPVRRLLTSPYRRCRQTLEPLCDVLGLPSVDEECLAPSSDPQALDALLRAPGNEGALLCTHGELLGGLLDLWRSTGEVAVPPTPETTAKGGSWILEESSGHRAAHYLKPLRVLDIRASEDRAATS